MGIYVPPGRESTRELLERISAPKGQLGLLRKIHGLKQVATSHSEESLKSLLLKAVDDMSPDHKLEKIDLVLFAHSTLAQFNYEEDFLDDLCETLGLENVPCYGVSHMNCASGLGALSLVQKLRSTDISRVLLLTADLTTSIPDARYVKNSTIVGDSASAMILELGCTNRQLLGVSMMSDPRFHRGFYEDDDGMKAFGRSYLENLESVIHAVLTETSLRLSDLKLILPHNVNETTWRKFCDISGFPRERVFLDLLPELGHSYCNDGPLNLRAAELAGKLDSGDKFLIINVGLGSYFGAAIFQY